MGEGGGAQDAWNLIVNGLFGSVAVLCLFSSSKKKRGYARDPRIFPSYTLDFH